MGFNEIRCHESPPTCCTLPPQSTELNKASESSVADECRPFSCFRIRFSQKEQEEHHAHGSRSFFPPTASVWAPEECFGGLFYKGVFGPLSHAHGFFFPQSEPLPWWPVNLIQRAVNIMRVHTGTAGFRLADSFIFSLYSGISTFCRCLLPELKIHLMADSVRQISYLFAYFFPLKMKLLCFLFLLEID